ncbi:hypothetical protein Tco_1575696 [Tanacetum coccineum]
METVRELEEPRFELIEWKTGRMGSFAFSDIWKQRFLASTVSSLMAYFVAILTPGSALSCVMQCTLPTQGMRSIISMVSISLEVVVVAIVGVVIVVMIIGVVVMVMVVVVVGGVSFIIKLSFVIIGFLHRSWAYAFHQDKASSVRVPVANVTLFSSAHLLRENTYLVRSNHRISLGPVFLLGLSAFAMAATCASRAAVIPSVISWRMAASVIIGVADVDVLLGGIYQHIQDNTE